MTAAETEQPAPALTERQLEVLRLLANGHDNRAVARELRLSTDGMKHHLRVIYAKLAARNAAHAVGTAFRAELLTTSDVVPRRPGRGWSG